jgi:hypothetical protein
MIFAINKAQHLGGDVDGEKIVSSDQFLLADGQISELAVALTHR